MKTSDKLDVLQEMARACEGAPHKLYLIGLLVEHSDEEECTGELLGGRWKCFQEAVDRSHFTACTILAFLWFSTGISGITGKLGSLESLLNRGAQGCQAF